MPGNGLILSPSNDAAIDDVLERGCWTGTETTGDTEGWSTENINKDGSQFKVFYHGELVGEVKWNLVGEHNVANALMAIGAARHVGVTADLACEALAKFVNTKRRLELLGEFNGISLYDDFAHHPTAVSLTLDGLRNKVGESKIIAVLEPRSATMKRGVHNDILADSLKNADSVYLYQPDNIEWSVQEIADKCVQTAFISEHIEQLVAKISEEAQPGDHILVMSNGGFSGIHEKLKSLL